MKRKLFATLLCLLMMATLLPVGSMATETAETPLLQNGDFEGVVDSSGNPNGWAYYSYDADKGAERIVTDATAAVQPQSGEKAVKIKGGSDNSRTYFYQRLMNLEAGKKYLVEGYINLPSESKFSAGICMGTSAEAYQFTNSSIAFVNMYSSGLISAKKTDGWIKVAKVFKYEPSSADEKWFLTFRAISATDIYLDNFSIEECDSIYKNGMDDYSGSTSLSIGTFINLGGFSSHLIDKNGEGYVESTAMRGQNILQIKLSDLKKFIPDLSSAQTLKLSWRLKIVEKTVLDDIDRWDLNLRFIKTGLSTNYGYKMTCVDSGEWADYEFYFKWDPDNNSFDQIQLSGLYAYTASGTEINNNTNPYSAKCQVDDIAIDIIGPAYIGSGKTVHSVPVNAKYSNSDPAVYVVGYGRTKTEAQYNSDETVTPFTRFATTQQSDSALTVTAIYKNEGSSRQLVDVITETLDATASATAYSTKSIDLSTLDLVAAEGVTYTAETYLWNDGTITPMKNKVVMPITVAVATPEN
ncbi:MAG: hypothetical protein E7390_04550 [Ruminococcaceae bacterium]|nr:hypothetical protein [Oscillospiraceae bacterium]